MQAQQLQHDLQKIMRRFGRQCRGMGNVLVTLVRQTETQLLECGHQVLPLARTGQARLAQRMTQLSEEQRTRLSTQLTAALEASPTDRTPIPTADAGQNGHPRQQSSTPTIPRLRPLAKAKATAPPSLAASRG